MDEIGDDTPKNTNMTVLKVKVKWGKETYEVQLDLSEDPEVFRAQLFALTGVTPDRQKVMCKGAILKDSWDNIKVKDGATLLMMGSKGEIPTQPLEKTIFVEDLDDAELASALKLPVGINNMGNTCYMNAVVQCLKTVPELTSALQKYVGKVNVHNSSSQNITAALRDLYKNVEEFPNFAPLIFLEALHAAFPRFAEKNDRGANMQQDANECWIEMVRMLQQQLPTNPAIGLPLEKQNSETVVQHKNLIDQLFGGKFEVTLKCAESEDELETQSKEDFLQLSCFVSSTEVRYLMAGLKLRMQEQLTKMSPTLNRDAVYQKTSRISRLPAYLTVSLVRFYYKEREAINAKILKDIKFPLMLDVFELCSTELQQKLMPRRDKFKAWDDEQVEKKFREEKKNDEQKEETSENIPFSFENDPGSNDSGFYQLQAVLTHKGRSSSSGHYVAWIRRNHKEWFKCDDDVVSPVQEEEILKLSGGGDWHCAYVLLYGPRILGVE